MRMAGSSVTAAPRARRRSDSSLAWARARVTTTRRPRRGPRRARDGRRERRHRPHDDHGRRAQPLLLDPLARACPGWRPRCAGAAWSPTARPPPAPRARGRPPAGRRRCRPGAPSPSGSRASRARAASAAQSVCSEGLPGSSCPVTTVNEVASPRWVTGIPAAAGAAIALVTPGTTSKGTPRGRQGLGLLAPAAEDERVAALQAHDPPAAAAVLDERRVDLVLGHRGAAGGLARVQQLGAGPAEGAAAPRCRGGRGRRRRPAPARPGRPP